MKKTSAFIASLLPIAVAAAANAGKGGSNASTTTGGLREPCYGERYLQRWTYVRVAGMPQRLLKFA